MDLSVFTKPMVGFKKSEPTARGSWPLHRGLQWNVPWFGVDYSPGEKNVCGGLDLGDVLDVIADWV